MARRGRPCRHDVPATVRIEVRVTEAEYRQICRFARSNFSSVADALRISVLTLIEDFWEDGDPPRAPARITTGTNSGGVL